MAQLTPLQQLAEQHRVGIDFKGWDGTPQTVSDETLIAVLTALGVPCATNDDVAASLRAAERAPWLRRLPPAVVIRDGDATTVPVTVPAGTTPSIHVLLEDGTERTLPAGSARTREVNGTEVSRFTVEIPLDLPLGWHTLTVRFESGTADCTLVVTPRKLTTADSLTRTWGLMAQLYSVRSRSSWGIGDLDDLARLAEISADKGAGFVLINPLHAAQPKPPVEASPYLPTTRRFFNPIYLRVENVVEFEDLPEAQAHTIRDLAAEFRAANENADIIDRDPSYAAKLQALELVFTVPRQPQREEAFQRFRSEAGPGLENFALWSALAETLPEGAAEWSDPEFLEEQRTELEDRIEFHAWLQWLCDEQLEAVQQAAMEAGMNLGIMHDLAVGVHPAGADAWTLRDVLASGISVGAPPDMFNQQGQDWAQPPWHPERLAESGYAAYRDMLRTILRHAGGIRIDHILGLFRLWWIPQGSMPGDGAYVYYDHEALIGILALEAERAGAVVVGEDLGAFEPGVQEYLAERGVLGTSILWFEYDDDEPRPAEQYRTACLTTVTTHDLPPSAGYLAGRHVELREQLGLLGRPVEEEKSADRQAQERVLALVRSTTGSVPATVQETVEAMHSFIAQTPSVLLGVALTDAVGEERTQNQPGTTAEQYPNWQVPLAGPAGVVLVEDLPDLERFDELVRALQR
ncbi:4-alpha-glucanotransferase [Arthrobacter sp. Soil782]|uniref:4-alpha-glucanotransferase n=1 Tax=Arthrobacter sp. Soil782 TaxID=1736410 RepID=UPI000700A822|nr:4-alpha-glucanotransferase [Arthrobacter sp. Soil782]KRF08737.1 4-alpha-glucanotransferase [Arthrobacter sp. Soil782]